VIRRKCRRSMAVLLGCAAGLLMGGPPKRHAPAAPPRYESAGCAEELNFADRRGRPADGGGDRPPRYGGATTALSRRKSQPLGQEAGRGACEPYGFDHSCPP